MRPSTPLLLLALASCVPKGKHEIVQIQLDATRVALATRESDLQQEIDSDNGRIAALEEEVSDRQVQLDALAARIDGLEAALDEAARREAEHVAVDQVACREPEPVEPEPGVRPRPKPIPEVPVGPTPADRRAHVDASVERMAEAVADAARRDARRANRAARHEAVVAAFQELVDDGLAEVVETDDGTVVRVLVAKLFNENRTSLSPLGEQLVERLATALNALADHTVRIDGHTDDQPVHSAEHPSNWELGFAYAVGVLRGLEEHGIPQDPVVASMAGARPVDPSDSDEARRLNRRVELVLVPERGVIQRFAPTPPDPEPEPGPLPDAPG